MNLFEPLIVLLILIAAVVLIIRKAGSRQKTETGLLQMGEEYLQELGTHQENGHEVHTICLYPQKGTDSWICPNCEGENPAEAVYCRVCYRGKP